MTLRPHQTRAIDAVRAVYRSGKRRVLLVMPTGAGKTHTAAVLIRASVDRGHRVLFLVHRREIVMDTHRRLVAAGVPCGLVMAGAAASDALVQVASVQTVAARECHPAADLVVWDEAHHAAASTYRDIAAQYPGAWHLGLTATPERADGAGLRDAFDEIVVGATVRELMDAKLLAECDVMAPQGRQTGLAEAPADAWVRLAGGRPTVAFCRTVAESLALAAALETRGVAARHIDGGTATKARDATLAAFAAGTVQVLTNVFVLTEGWDCPRAKVCLLARGCGSEGTYLQMVGRVLRPDGDARALVIDLAGVVHEHGMPEEPRVFSLDGITRRPREERPWIAQCRACGLVVEGVKRGPSCGRCGEVWPPPPAQKMKLAPVVACAGAAVVKKAEKIAEFNRLREVAARNKYKPAWVGMKFKERFGHWPGHSIASARAGGVS